ncbi:ERF family protein [Polynucleobacter sp.]|uniref:ERF family protein n=1 Tax=Polynucleobacter sp. TaxID=2029855 RepID=UPI003F69A207
MADIKELPKNYQLYQALAEVQKHEINPKKKGKGVYNNTYATLEDTWNACRKILNDANILVSQTIRNDTLRTTIVHTKSGESIESTMPLMNEKSGMQGLGSAITYARRYALTTIIGAIPEDDDGQATVATASTTTSQPTAGTTGGVSDKQKNYLHGLLKGQGLTGELAIKFSKDTINKPAPITSADYSAMIDKLKDLPPMAVEGE